MTARYVVTLVEPCETCNGTGYVPSSGFPCIRCLGTRERRTDVPITEVLRALGVRFVDTTQEPKR